MAASSYTELIGPVARHFWGDPNEQLSKPNELRFGSQGSKSVDLEKNTFFDHEADCGGGGDWTSAARVSFVDLARL